MYLPRLGSTGKMTCLVQVVPLPEDSRHEGSTRCNRPSALNILLDTQPSPNHMCQNKRKKSCVSQERTCGPESWPSRLWYAAVMSD